MNASATTTGTITPAAVTVFTTPDTKTYDGTVTSSATPTIVGLVPGDSAVVGQTFATQNAGSTVMVINQLDVTDGNNGNNYTYSFVNVPGLINPAALTISAVTDGKIYDGTTVSSATPIVSGLVGSDSASATQVFDSKNAGPRTLLVDGFNISDGNGGNNYTVSLATALGSIDQRGITVTAQTNTKTYDGTSSATATPLVTSGSLAAGDTPNFTESYDNRDAGSGKTLSTSGTIDDGNGGANYYITFLNDSSGVINQAALTITAISDTKVYDGTTISSMTPTIIGLMPGDGAGASQAFDSPNAGARNLVVDNWNVNDGTGGNNYIVNTVSASGSITPAQLTVTTDDATRTYGDNNPAFSGTISGFVNGEDATFALTGAAGYSTSATPSSDVGSYTISSSLGSLAANNGNYTFTFTDGTLAITPAELTVTANDAAKNQGDPNPAFTATITG